ncbi:MAG: L-aspartate oxidase [Lachnospiraceae bacterium]|nr:L-aspartate oxidase [Lachnospiraceae bacterium]
MDRQYDVIIVGCGVAGCFGALHLPSDRHILMITKSEIEESDSFLAQGGICVLKDENDYDAFFEDTMKAGHYENRKESVDMMISSSRSVIDELIAYGVDFEMKDGELVYTREGAHSTNRILYHEDITGQEITSTLLEQVKKLDNVELLDHTEMLDLLCKENRCDGILLRTKDGEIRPVFASHILLATGGIGGIYDNSTNFPHLTGDALALALRHDIKVENLNYVQIHPTTYYSEKKERRFLVSESVRGEGATLLDKDGNRFANELLPRDLLTKEILKQMDKDHTKHVWLNMMAIKDLDIKKRFPHIVEHCLENGVDPTKEYIPVVPAQHYFMGGIYVDLNSHTSMNHLYAAGETCCNGVHGRNRLASNSLLESLVFARNAATHMLESDQVRTWEGRSPKFLPYVDLSLDEIAAKYKIDLDWLADDAARVEAYKDLVWDEIDREEQEGNSKS